MRIRWTGSAIAALLLAFLPSCAPSEKHATTTSPTSSSQPRDGGRLVRRLENDANTLNAALQTTEYEHYVLEYLHTPLIQLDRNLQPIPGTVAKWEVSDDHLTYTLHIDPRATYTDGQPVRASDVLFTIAKMIDSPQFSAWFDNYDKDHSAIVDDHTVRVAFKKPRVAQLFSFNVPVLPEHVYGKGDFKKNFNDAVVGDGPYKLVSWQRGQTITLQRRPDYWGDKPHIDTILFKVISEDNVAWLATKRGDVDETRLKNDIWAAEKDRPDIGNLNFFDIYHLSYNCIAWNLRDPLFADARVRTALAMAYDRDAIIKSLYRGQARSVSGPFTPDETAYDQSVKPIAYDPAGATALLTQAGWVDSNHDGVVDRNGKKLEFDILMPAGSQVALEQVQTYQQGLQKIGVKLNMRPLDGASMFDRIMKTNFQSAFMAWSLDADPDLGQLFASNQKPPAGLNVVGYSNPEVDALIEQSRVEFDQNKRTEIFHQLHRILARDQPYLWTVQVASKSAVNKRVHDVQVSKGFGLYGWSPGPNAWWLSGR